MANRPEPEVILDRKELEDYRRVLSKLSTSSLEHEYQRVYQDCRIEGPATRSIAAIGDVVEGATRSSEITTRA
jgi:hypothetical protein